MGINVLVTGIDVRVTLPDEIIEGPNFSDASLRKEIASALTKVYGGALKRVEVAFAEGEIVYVNGKEIQ